jgi:hypothetical protein
MNSPQQTHEVRLRGLPARAQHAVFRTEYDSSRGFAADRAVRAGQLAVTV